MFRRGRDGIRKVSFHRFQTACKTAERPPRIQSFSIARLSRIHFGPGVIAQNPDLAVQYGRRALLVTGKHSFQVSSQWERLRKVFDERGFSMEHLTVCDEPSPDLIDGAVSGFRSAGSSLTRHCSQSPAARIRRAWKGRCRGLFPSIKALEILVS